MKKLWNFISNLGIHPGLTPEEQRRIQLLNRLDFVALDVLLLYVVMDIALGVYVFVPFLAVFISSLFLTLYLVHSRRYEVAKYFSIVSMIAIILFFAIATGTSAYAQILMIPLVAMPLIILRSKPMAFVVLGVVVTLLSMSVWLQSRIPPFEELEQHVLDIMGPMNIATAAIVTFLLTYYFRLANENYERKILGAQAEIEERNKEIMDSINYAKRIQAAIMPPDSLVEKWVPNGFILYKPKDVVAGDFYWMHHLPKPNGWDGKDTLLIAAADCTGHGVPGAMVSVVCSGSLDRCVQEFGITDPGEMLTKTRELVVHTFEQSEEDVKDGMDVALCALHKESRDKNQDTRDKNQESRHVLKYAGANNPLWIIRDGEVMETKGTKQPVGLVDEPKPFTTHTFELEDGDSFYIFSDGYVDQFGGERGKKFKAKAFKELLLSIQDKTMAQQRELINDAFEAWRGDLEQVDDVCVIGVRV